MALDQTLRFLAALARNNEKAWFDAHRADYDRAREAFEALVAELIVRFDVVDDLGGVSPKECMYRIHRDVRFSKDKTPYKTQMGALIARGGRKAQGRWYYVQIQPGDQSMVAGGLYHPTPAQIDATRRAIAEDSTPLREIIAAPDFVRTFGALDGETLKVAPAGYSKTHPDIDLLRRKEFTVGHALPDASLTSSDLVDHILSVCQTLKPFVVYFDEIANDRPASG